MLKTYFNPYRVGSLLWLERNDRNFYKRMVDMLIDGALSLDDVIDEVRAYESDTID